ncbi:hypothetical protein C5F63_13020 [Photobacterium damselae subsp. damselae]|uniref:hypothetical protein n=2 Tax=Photobacterium damselae TaxID=38293 RepID=UPI000D07A8B2|nr:hypothetical protein [Photobacterium damselae]PSB86074.1 hypothetical protein C5F63_13020 [Photobacterium damselae subsp. damselae]
MDNSINTVNKSEQEFLKCMKHLCTIARSYNTTGVPPRFEPPVEGQYNYRVADRYVYMYQGMLDALKAFELLEVMLESLINYPGAKKIEWIAELAWEFYQKANSPVDPKKLVPFQVWYAMRTNWQMFIINYIGLGYRSAPEQCEKFRLTDEEMASLTPEQHEWVLSVQDKDDYELFGCID